MSLKLGYLLPTRENIMNGQPSGRLLLDRARQARQLGFDSLWVGDSLLAKPRHDPLTVLSAVAAAVPGVDIGTAVLLPALRNPVVLAQQLATIDQLSEGRLIVGASIAGDADNIRHEFRAAGVPFEGRVGRMMEGFRLCRALWTGEPVDWDGRWSMNQAVLAPTPYRKGGPPIWIGAAARPSIERTARNFDGWIPVGPDPETYRRRREHLLDVAREAGRDVQNLTSALYLTLAIGEDEADADRTLNDFLFAYYGVDPASTRRYQACFAGTVEDAIGYIRSFVQAGSEHIVFRLAGDHLPQMKVLCQHRDELEARAP